LREPRFERLALQNIADALAAAWQLVLSNDPTLVAIVSLSLGVSLTAVLLASVLGLPLGAALVVLRFPGRNSIIVIVNALMGLPPVVGVMLVNPEKHPHVKQDLGRRFIEWLISPAGQQTIADYRIGGESLFFPDA
jgi:ABC-type tungstate transport system permease subunit